MCERTTTEEEGCEEGGEEQQVVIVVFVVIDCVSFCCACCLHHHVCCGDCFMLIISAFDVLRMYDEASMTITPIQTSCSSTQRNINDPLTLRSFVLLSFCLLPTLLLTIIIHIHNCNQNHD